MSTLDANQRSLCATTSAWLHSIQTLAAVALVAALVAIQHLFLGSALHGLAVAVMLLGLTERYLALRIDFDARVFDALARVAIATPEAFDTAREQLGLGRVDGDTRSIEDRARGAMRLSWRYVFVVVLQTLATATLLALHAR